ncbi:ethanolamine ammonia-lyase subunit EutC [Acidocella aminolytica]|jgi:ethanolamine ammonia-lyase small subunit|uniref:Ethanolamine ammonia-lyase small subunit n=1 Tax=Acidocella aminolytica 101 = DSM 11237 TaxID=1120923 RepID=A0A0D6PMB6_9PROT|nr:ethanolamine ammonia-lyase subunit EutC [Acidocella aminolytica]GAN81944.1 ethanolamine ammonia lyase small subunit [Acidocella aminolytica 101 = DSM 11237]GBQ38567.1 ethanolamine ammonia-lyase small subunit [Acidocella aminolytica 101 = DSM 11237]SHE76458.1 Ethanolamine ammonia-lyase light chain [Acidocella aminolytica 101 = DSM 11237]
MPPEDPWAKLRQATRARIGLGRAGDAMKIGDVLDFQFAHAKARDAVHTMLDTAALRAALPGAIALHSEAPDRETYLRRPDLGRKLARDCLPLLSKSEYDAAIVIADGLSATAVMQNAVPVYEALTARLSGFKLTPPIIATQARVALGDDIGEALGVKLVAVLIGERPGLTVSDSLGIYLTYAPKRGTLDSARNCISNVHAHGGLSHGAAADMLAWLMREALRRGLTGVGLKEASGLTQDGAVSLVS